MKKIKSTDNDEIDLVGLIINVWDHKLKVILFLSISIIIATFYIYKQPNLFKISLNIKPAGNSEFIKYIPIQSTLFENKLIFAETDINKYIVNNETIFKKFLDELMDYEELISVLKNDVYIKNISELSKLDQQNELVNYAKRLDVIKSGKNEINYTLQFMWHDAKQGKKILDETLSIVLKNLKKNIISDIRGLAEAINVRNLESIETLSIRLNLIAITNERKAIAQNQTEKYFANKNNSKKKKEFLERIEYLKDQSKIAKKLGIENDISINNNRSNLPDSYYLRGYKAIDIEINLLENRKKYMDSINAESIPFDNEPAQSDNYIRLMQSISEHKNDLSAKRLIDKIELLKNDNENNWINYDILFADIKSMKKSSFKILFLSIVLGLTLGIFYVLLYQAFSNKKIS